MEQRDDQSNKPEAAVAAEGQVTAPEEDFGTLLAASEAGASRQTIAVGDVVRGRVIAIGQASAFVAVGGKGEATIDLTEFRDPATGELSLAVGDQLEATVVDDGSGSGSILLKRTLGRGGHVPAELEQAMMHRIPVEGVVTAENKGGFEVQIGSVRAFCPGSLIDRRRSDRPAAAQHIGQRYRFRVTKIEGGGRNVVVSRRELLEEATAEQAARTWETLQVGAIVRGTVSNLREFGAFVDLGGVEGLVHISELSYGRIGHPSEVLQVGQTVDVQVVKLDPPPSGGAGSRRQVGLSLRALAVDPWTTAAERFPVGTTVRGTVRRLEAFGAFVEIAPGLDGLVHVSKLALDRRVSHARQGASLGQEVEVTVLAIEPAKRRISLSMIEAARAVRDASIVTEGAEVEGAVAQSNQRASLGTLAELLAASRRKS